MRLFQNLNKTPKKLQREITQNSNDMKNFYAMPVEKRQDVLNRISRLNSKEEIEEFLED